MQTTTSDKQLRLYLVSVDIVDLHDIEASPVNVPQSDQGLCAAKLSCLRVQLERLLEVVRARECLSFAEQIVPE